MILAHAVAVKNTKNAVDRIPKDYINIRLELCSGRFFDRGASKLRSTNENSIEANIYCFPKSLDFADFIWYCVVLPEVKRNECY